MRHPLALIAVIVGVALAPVAASATTVHTLQLGATFTIRGITGAAVGKSRAVGIVVVRRTWSGGTPSLVTTVHTDSRGHYEIVLKPRRRGLLTIRVTPPDNHTLQFIVHVT